jgi:hypothetical protein
MDARDVETFWDGAWMTRRVGCAEPFSRGGPRLRQICIGAEVARWAGVRHLIRDRDGTIEEINVYSPGPYPSRSPSHRVRPDDDRPPS